MRTVQSSEVKTEDDYILSYYLPSLSKILPFPIKKRGADCKTSTYRFTSKMSRSKCDSGKSCANSEICSVE